MALAIVLGAAVAADLLFLTRAAFRPIDRTTILSADYLSILVAGGLLALWVTGVALAWMQWSANPAFISNEKFWAKVFIVVLLTINAELIHDVILPCLRARVGQRMFEGLNVRDRLLFALGGALSISSWLFPTLLGAARELNNRTPAHEILTCYYVSLGLGFATILALSVISALRAREATQVLRPARS
jgi:hypothetical protein